MQHFLILWQLWKQFWLSSKGLYQCFIEVDVLLTEPLLARRSVFFKATEPLDTFKKSVELMLVESVAF